MTQHTPTPFKVHNRNPAYICTGPDCGTMWDKEPSPCKVVAGPMRTADAAFIVLAVNSHDALLAAAEALLKGRRHDSGCALDKRPSQPCDCTIAQGRAAIKQAKEGDA